MLAMYQVVRRVGPRLPSPSILHTTSLLAPLTSITSDTLNNVATRFAVPQRCKTTTTTKPTAKAVKASTKPSTKTTKTTKPIPKTTKPPLLVSVLQHSEYSAMKAELSRRPNPGALDTLSLHILRNPHKVNHALLRLDALSPGASTDASAGRKGGKEIQEMKEAGEVMSGKFNLEDEQVILSNYREFIQATGVDEDDLQKQLFASTTGRDRTFMLQRQLVGFSLLQGLEDQDKRLPMEVYTKLAVYLFGGTFTEEEDAAILAWVEEHGPTRWTELARSLGRKYLQASATVSVRYRELTGRQEGQRRGAYGLEELTVLMEEVMKQNPGALEQNTVPSDLDWTMIASIMNRPRIGLNSVYSTTVHPTVRRHKAGTLGEDVRGQMLQQVVQEGWSYGANIEFDILASRPQFRGHTRASLCHLFDGMRLNTMKKLPGVKKSKEVTVEQVEEWWGSSVRREKSQRQVEKEEGIVEAYYRLRR